MSAEDHFVDVRYSKDGGHNWSNFRRISLGAVGEYEKRVKMNRLGRGRQIVFHIRVSSPIRRDLLGMVAYVEGMDG